MSNIDRAVENYTRACFRDAYEGRPQRVNRCDECGKPIPDSLAICEKCWEKHPDNKEAA